MAGAARPPIPLPPAHTTFQLTGNNEQWYRIASLVYNALLPAIKDILHNKNGDPSYTGLPVKESDLYDELSNQHMPIINGLLKKKVLSKDQYNVLLPANKLTYSSSFDLTLTACLIRNILNLPCASSKWEYDKLQPNDFSLAACVVRSRYIRNFLSHNAPDTVDNVKFLQIWAEGVRIINALKFPCDMPALLVAPLDKTTCLNAANIIRLQKELNATKLDLGTLEKDVGILSQDVGANRLDIGSINQDLSAMQKDVGILSQDVGANRLDIGSIKQDLSATQKDVGILSQDVGANRLDIGSIKQDLSATQEDVEILNREVGANKLDIGLIKHDLSATQEDVGILNREVGANKLDIGSIKEDLSTTQKDVGANKLDIGSVKQDLNATQKNIGSVKREVGVMKVEFTKLKEELHRNKHGEERDDASLDNIPILLNEFVETIADDGTKHTQTVGQELFYLWCHHNQQNNPAELLSSFNPKIISPAEDITYDFCKGGRFSKKYSREELEETFVKRFEEYYIEELSKQNCFITNVFDDCTANEGFRDFCDQMKIWCMGKKLSFMIINHSSIEHLQMLGFDVKKLKEALKIKKEDDTSNMLLVHVPEQGVMFSIRYLADSTINEDSLCNKINSGLTDIKLISGLFYELFTDIKVCLVSLFVLGNISREHLAELDACISCKNDLVLTKDDIENNNSLGRKLSSFFHPNYLEIETNEQRRKFISFASRVVGSLCVKDVHLPQFSDDCYTSLHRVYLNYDQWKFVYLLDSHVILRGGYGSGKSILAQVKLRQLVIRGNKLYTVYFITFSGAALYNETLKKQNCFHSTDSQVIILTAQEYYDKYNLQGPVLLSSILIDIARRNKSSSVKPSVIIDEYDGWKLNVEEAEQVKNNSNNFSYLLIVPQSMDTKRERCTVEGKRLYGGYEYERTGMKIRTLNRTMRNSKNINELSRVTAEILKRHESISCDPERNESISCDSKGSQKADELTKKDKISSKGEKKSQIVKSVQVMVKQVKKVKKVGKKKKEIPKPTTDNSQQEESNAKRSEQVSPVPVFSEIENKETQHISLHFDHVLKQVADLQSPPGDDKIVSKFDFSGRYEPGHHIEGTIPRVIHPFGKDKLISYNNINNWEIKCSIVYLLQNIVEIRKGLEGLCVICFDAIDVKLYENVAKLMDIPVRLYTPALGLSNEKQCIKDLHDKLATYMLITDHVGCRGMEFPRVIISIDPGERFLHQYLLESLTRCLGDLYFTLIRKSSLTEIGPHSCADVIEEWEAKTLVEKVIINICNNEECADAFSEACIDDNNGHNIHPNSRCFDIKDTIKITEVDVDTEGFLKNYELLTNPELVNENWAKQKHLREFSMRKMEYVTECCEINDYDAIKILMDLKGEEIMKYRCKRGDSILHIAAKYNAIEIIKLMLGYGMSIDVRNKEEQTPLMVAVMNRSTESVEYLAEQGADMNAKDLLDNNSIALAKNTEDKDILGILERHQKESSILRSPFMIPWDMNRNPEVEKEEGPKQKNRPLPKIPSGRSNITDVTYPDKYEIDNIDTNIDLSNMHYVQYDFDAENPDTELSVTKGELIRVRDYDDYKIWCECQNRNGKVGWLPYAHLVPYSSLYQFDWYHGGISRNRAEFVLSCGINGSYLMRESESAPGEYSLSLRYEGRMYHYRIHSDEEGNKYVSEEAKFDTLEKLLTYHSNEAGGLITNLRYPALKVGNSSNDGLSVKDDEWEMPRMDVYIGMKIGDGQYTEVYVADYKKYNETVAVKTLKDDQIDIDEFLEEAEIMKQIKHSNLLKLIGVCTREKPIYIITEYMPKGNLLEYLRKANKAELRVVTLVYMTSQIAAAMKYLEEKKIIHRDLQARNCLVGEHNSIKVAGFGLARFVPEDCYEENSDAKCPIKWSSPETLAYNKSFSKSDVWAFGVLMWEIWTYGMSPYPGLELTQLHPWIEKGNRMECPSGCPEPAYQIMMDCWQWLPSNRPSFADICYELEQIFNALVPPRLARRTRSRDDLLKSRDNLLKSKEYLSKSRDNLLKSRDNPSKNRNNLSKSRDNLSKSRDDVFTDAY